MNPVKVGVIGCGNISGAYFAGMAAFDILEIAACSDLVAEKAEAKAEEFDVPKACTVDELLSDSEIEIVVNLTIPSAHEQVALAALEHGKSVYNEKPLATSVEHGRRVIDLSKKKGLLLGCAPDTFFGGGGQTCRKIIDDGVIGRPVAATAFMMCHGHESWHPDPEFYYKRGGGPLFDMGPYYLTTLVNLVGPVERVAALANITFPERTITSEPKKGEKISVETPTHIAGLLDFADGAAGTIVMSFDVWAAQVPCIEIYGTEGTLRVPDPNTFGGPVSVWKDETQEWEDVALTHGYTENSRGIGVADMAYALRSGRQHRASGVLAYHVLDVMESLLDSGREGRFVDIESACGRPAPLPVGLKEGKLDE